MRQVVVPLAMPSILTGLRFSAGISVIALVFTESIGANQGIGYLVSPGRQPAADPGPRRLHRHLRAARHRRRPPRPPARTGRHAVAAPRVSRSDDRSMQPRHARMPRRRRLGVGKSFGDRTVLARPRRHRRPGRVRGAARRVGQRQDHAAAHSGRARGAVGRRGARARGPHRRLPGTAPRGVACGCGATSCSGCPGRADPPAPRPRRAARGRTRRSAPTPGRARSRAARPSAWPWPAPWSASRSSSCSTSPSPPSTPSPASRCRTWWPTCAPGTARACSWSPTTSKRPSCWPTGCWCCARAGSRLDVAVDLPRPRRIGGPPFDALRDRLLAELGVHREAALT